MLCNDSSAQTLCVCTIERASERASERETERERGAGGGGGGGAGRARERLCTCESVCVTFLRGIYPTQYQSWFLTTL